MVLAIIPARGGSKAIPRKNLASLAGRPLIEYTVNAARQSRGVDEILLSTDNDEIAAVGAGLGLDVRYRRPAELAGDATGMIESVEHGIHWFEQDRGRLPDHILLLQPTSPLRIAADIDGAISQYRESGARSLVSVHAMSEHPAECLTDAGVGWAYLVPPPAGAVRRQDYRQEYFFINGAIYLSETRTLLERRSFIDPLETRVFVMPRERGIDVDTPLDLAIAESILKASR